MVSYLPGKWCLPVLTPGAGCHLNRKQLLLNPADVITAMASMEALWQLLQRREAVLCVTVEQSSILRVNGVMQFLESGRSAGFVAIMSISISFQ